MADWFVGQRVVCVHAIIQRHRFRGEKHPVVGGVYTIRAIVDDYDGIGIQLEEIVNSPRPYVEGMGEMTFDVRRFRPVVEPQTDISVFTQILDRVNRHERVDA